MTSWRNWMLGLIGAAINSAAGGIALIIVDPLGFSPFHGGLVKLGTVMFTLALVGAGLYLKDHKLPGTEVP